MHIINLWWPAREIGRLRRHIAANAAAAYFRLPSWPALTSLELNLGDGKRAQSREKSVPDDFLRLCSFSSEVTPLPTSVTTQMCTVLPFPPTDVPPSHNYSLKPKDLAIAQLLSYLRSLSHFTSPPTILPSLATPLCSLPECIPAWQTTWDFTSPLKSAASGNHSSPCNILVF